MTTKEIAERKRRFRLEFLPSIIGTKFHVPRGYGHAAYEIVGGGEEWRTGDHIKIYIDMAKRPPVICNYGGDSVVAIVVKRVGGYSGPPTAPTLQVLLEDFDKIREN